MLSFIFLVFISLMILVAPIYFSLLTKTNIKESPYECGFINIGAGQSLFSLRFFLISLIFLIFDVEVALLLPLIGVTPSSNSLIMWVILGFFFLLILLFGTFLEWKNKAFNWK